MAWSEEEQEPLAIHHSDTRNVTVTLGTGNFKFVSLETCDSKGNAKSVFAKGESVYFNASYRNDGDVKASPILVITDTDANKELKRMGLGVTTGAPGEVNSQTAIVIGTMPDADWHLRFDMTP